MRTTFSRIAESPRIKKRFKIKCKSPGHQRLGLLPIRCSTFSRIAESPRIKKRFKIKCKSPGHQRLGLLPIRCSATPGFRRFCSIYRTLLRIPHSCFGSVQFAKYRVCLSPAHGFPYPILWNCRNEFLP